MLVTIQTVSQESGDFGEYVKVVGVQPNGKETTKNVSDRFKDKWSLLQGGNTVDFKMVQKNNKWQIVDISLAGSQLPSPIIGKEPPKPTPSYKGRDEDKVDKRTLVMEIGADWRAGLRGKDDILVIAREAFLLDWANGGRDVKTTKELPDEETIPGTTRVDDTGGDGKTFKDVGKLLTWYTSHGVDFTFQHFCDDCEVTRPSEVTDLDKAYKDLKSKHKWGD